MRAVATLAIPLALAACGGRKAESPPAAGSAAAASPAAASPAATAPTAANDACAILPGALVASALGGTLADTRGFDAATFRRCTYFLTTADPNTRRAFVIYFNPAHDYEGLREAHDGPVENEPGLGDAAYRYQDADTKRFWITALKRGRITLQVTGDSLDAVRKLTALALSRY